MPKQLHSPTALEDMRAFHRCHHDTAEDDGRVWWPMILDDAKRRMAASPRSLHACSSSHKGMASISITMALLAQQNSSPGADGRLGDAGRGTEGWDGGAGGAEGGPAAASFFAGGPTAAS